MKTNKRNRTRGLAAVVLTASLTLAGCGDLLTVENPGLIADDVLDNPSIVPALVVGIGGDYAQAMNTVTQVIGEMTFEITAAGPTLDPYTIGVLEPNFVDPWWNAMQKARWVAESGVTRIEGLVSDDDRNLHLARANMFAGFANRLLGENVCEAVIDGGAPQPRALHFQRAEGYFTKAAQIAQTIGTTGDQVRLASLGGRASVRAWQGNWTGAAADASSVPASFVFRALYASSTTREENALYGPSYIQFYTSVHSTPWATANDKRTPFVILRDAKGAVMITRDGRIPMYAQSKYPLRDSDIPVTSGVEMLVLRAEAALRAGDIPGTVALLDQNRTQWAMGPVTPPANEAAAWDLLKFERGATLWLEARRFWDLARWFDAGKDASLKDRARCMPIGRTEIQTNVNLADRR